MTSARDNHPWLSKVVKIGLVAGGVVVAAVGFGKIAFSKRIYVSREALQGWRDFAGKVEYYIDNQPEKYFGHSSLRIRPILPIVSVAPTGYEDAATQESKTPSVHKDAHRPHLKLHLVLRGGRWSPCLQTVPSDQWDPPRAKSVRKTANEWTFASAFHLVAILTRKEFGAYNYVTRNCRDFTRIVTQRMREQGPLEQDIKMQHESSQWTDDDLAAFATKKCRVDVELYSEAMLKKRVLGRQKCGVTKNVLLSWWLSSSGS